MTPVPRHCHPGGGSYVMVDDVEKTVIKARKVGAKVQVDQMDIGQTGARGKIEEPGQEPGKKRK
jgi:hypothetical protein